ncbi:SDR family NAD(P)-dependent oxidoreductase [Actinomadura rubrisoli]|uniref:SDR family NAD(P)-dependent oxidoreductase n=1 Tax=Actinomadura rubrisoli TaxID=2530368 RepID=A0A4R5AX75_9ACTN|nr:SDR family NAD(P)-dependent oxidoreductase [Actinomadura rubrisoli]TDD76619.1 SDR family NAD(P)-dependent oxidoreductase [Actinomadura rubrisoli]
MSRQHRQRERRAFVSGATSGIGLAVAERLAADGAQVFICARDAEAVARTVKELRDQGADADGTACDVRDAGRVREVVEEANAPAPVNVVVNNAGRGGGGPTAQIADELWDDVIATNLTSVFQVTRGFLAAGLKDAGWGRVINIASTAGKQGVVLGAPYSASKHGVVGFTKALGLELAKSGVTVNAVCPGYVETPMAQGIRKGYADFWGVTEDEVLAKFEAKIPLGRYTTPEEVAGLVGYLAGPSTDAVTAQAINVCGGLGNF